MCPLLGRCPSPPFLHRPLLSPSRDGPLFRNFGAHRSQSRVGALRYALLVRRLITPHTDRAFLSGLYFALFADCVKVLYNKRRRRAGGNHRLILVSTTLFVLITWVRCLSLDPAFLSYPIQHLVLDIVRLYLAFQGSETEHGADLYFDRVTSSLSIVKTSVYLAETIVSDLFIVCTQASSSRALY